MSYYIGPTSFLKPVAPTLAVSASAPSFSITETLQQFLEKSLKGTLSWTHKQESHAQGIKDIFSADRNGVAVQLEGVRSILQKSEKIPESLHHWVVYVTWKKKNGEREGKETRKVLDGKQLNLPSEVNANTNTQENTLAKLFRVAYQKVADLFSEFVPVIKFLCEQLQEKAIDFSYTFIKPDLRYALPGGKMLQIGNDTPRLEIFRSGAGGLQVTLYREDAKPVKFASQALRNPSLHEALDTLLQEVNHQRTGQRRGLEFF